MPTELSRINKSYVPSTKILYRPSRQPLHCIGQFAGKFSHKGKAATQPVFVVKGLKSNFLGLPAITALRLVTHLDMTEAAEDYQMQFPSLFEGLGNLGEPFMIHLKEGAVPHCIYTPRQVPLPLREKVKQELDKMESMGVIEKSNDPTPWCAGMVVVLKRNGKIRICGDLKPLNESVLREIQPFQELTIHWHNSQEPSSLANWTPILGSGRCLWPRNLNGSQHSSLPLEGTTSKRCHLESSVPLSTSRR